MAGQEAVAAKGNRKRAGWGEGRVAYAALAPEIAKALATGLPMTKVHALFEDRLGMSYRQFIRYAKPNLSKQEKTDVSAPRPVQKPARNQTREIDSRTSVSGAGGDARGFHFDPTDIDSKKLI
jgi:hypothetical protein